MKAHNGPGPPRRGLSALLGGRGDRSDEEDHALVEVADDNGGRSGGIRWVPG